MFISIYQGHGHAYRFLNVTPNMFIRVSGAARVWHLGKCRGVSEDLLIKSKNVIFYRFTCLYSFSAFNNGILPSR